MDHGQNDNRVALVCMPFGFEYKPNLPLSQLKADLVRVGVPADLWYLNLRLADRIGAQAYHDISVGRPSYQDLLGEWIFSSAGLHEPDPDRDQCYRRHILERSTIDHRTPPDDAFLATVEQVRAAIPAFLDECVTTIDWSRYRLVVFVVPFLEQQLAASLALARRLAELPHGAQTLVGGSGIEGASALALLRAFPFVDYTCSGEWDEAVPAFVRALLSDANVDDVPGINIGSTVRSVDDDRWRALLTDPPQTASVAKLDELPYPDYDDFFAAYEASAFTKLRTAPAIVFETSRGCWWGTKHHCTFCGLNQANMVYRAKSPDRALAEIEAHRHKYRGRFGRMEAKDTIMPMEYLRTLFPELHARGIDASFFYEIKANLKRDQVQTLAGTGCSILQPGIESFSTPILSLMRKGVTALQNIQFLRDARTYQLRLIYNVLVGFPGEPEEEYERQAAIVPMITHLQPPGWWGSIHLDRFSPYHYEPETFGIRNIRPAPAYPYVFPDVEPDLLLQLGYLFDFDSDQKHRVATYTKPLLDAVRVWARLDGTAYLTHRDDGDSVEIADGRDPERVETHLLTGVSRQVYLACDTGRGFARLLAELPADESEVRKALDDLADRRLVLGEDDRWLALGLPAGTRAQNTPNQHR